MFYPGRGKGDPGKEVRVIQGEGSVIQLARERKG